LAVFLITFNSIRAEERTSVLTLFNLTTTAAMVIGSLLGAGVLIAFGTTRPVYYALFAGSALLRTGTLYFLKRVPARLIEPLNIGRSRPASGSARHLPLRPIAAALMRSSRSAGDSSEPSDELLGRTA